MSTREELQAAVNSAKTSVAEAEAPLARPGCADWRCRMTALLCIHLGVLSMRSHLILLAVLLIPSLLLAGTPSEPSPGSEPVIATGGTANAGSISSAGALAGGGAGGDGGTAVAGATGGAGGTAAAEQTQAANANASNDGNAQSVAINHRRSAPSLAQGSLMAAGCGAGANGGASRGGGAGFLGFVWTTEQCYALLAAESFRAIGMPDTSCDLLVSMRSVQKAFKRAGRELPDCTAAENRDLTSALERVAIEHDSHAPMSDGTCETCVTQEHLDRAFRKSLQK